MNFKQNFKRQLKASMDRTDGLSRAERAAVIQEYDAALDREKPPRLVLIGEAGVGKSTTINALFNAGQKVGHTRATTDRAEAVTVEEINGGKGSLEVVDMPGLGDDVANYDRYLDLYLRVLPTADAILWVHAAEDRMVHLVQQALFDIFSNSRPELIGRLVFGLNKADEMNPRDWNPSANLPSAGQLAALGEREQDFTAKVHRALPTWRGRAVSYSALRYYNLSALFKAMMYAVPEERRWVLEKRMDLADFTTLVDRKLLRAAEGRTLAEVTERPRPTPTPAPPPPPAPDAEDPAVPNSLPSAVDSAIAGLSETQWRKLSSDRDLFRAFLRNVEEQEKSG
ncbi:GTPase family protein [Streptomyces paludis]|uniref:G domain-containing protein n=1 Tax=Streptomyces paludis TaxID=2282738 RepID=A0A345HSZ2_9ACTN|nr:GTPase [Streptomyces paludis]AXG79816.1 hypothetical protein DVK44_21590 [Streptomyces paludis]